MSRCRLTREEIDSIVLNQRCQTELLSGIHRQLVQINHKLPALPPHRNRTRFIAVEFNVFPVPTLTGTISTSSSSTHPTPLPGVTAMADLVLLVGQSSTATITPLEADGVTVTPGATLSNAVFSLTDPSLSIIDAGNGTALISGVAASTADVSGTASATVTDSDGTVTQLSKTFTVSVGAVILPPPTGRTVSLGVSFSTPA